jgi:hypothetical protein
MKSRSILKLGFTALVTKKAEENGGIEPDRSYGSNSKERLPLLLLKADQ